MRRIGPIRVHFGEKEGGKQCDQMARLFINIWPFTTINICPKT